MEFQAPKFFDRLELPLQASIRLLLQRSNIASCLCISKMGLILLVLFAYFYLGSMQAYNSKRTMQGQP